MAEDGPPSDQNRGQDNYDLNVTDQDMALFVSGNTSSTRVQPFRIFFRWRHRLQIYQRVGSLSERDTRQQRFT